MSFVTALSPHILISIAMLLLLEGVDGVQIPRRLSARRDGDHGSGDGGGDGPPSSTTSPIIPPSASSSSPSQTSNNSHTNTPPSTSSFPSQSSSISPIPSSTTSLSSSTSPLSTSTSNPVRLAQSHTGTIVGAVLGSAIVAGLGLMILTYCRRRARRARKQPKGSRYFDEPQTEMSQTQNSLPLTSAAPLVHRPVPIHFFNPSSRDNSPSSSLPLILAEANSHDGTTSSSHRPSSISEPDGGSEVPSDPLESHYDKQPFLSLDIPQPERAVLAAPASSSTSGQLSPLHRDMVDFQKALEADHKRDISDRGQSTSINDPPPEYVR